MSKQQKVTLSRRFSAAFILIIALPTLLVSVVLSFWCAAAFFLHYNYLKGGLSLYNYPKANAEWMFTYSADQIGGNAQPPDATAYGGFAVGVVVTILLIWLRASFTWWPLHPLAYAIAPTWAMSVFWFPFFLAWLVKSNVMRFGGVDGYRKLAPLMLGLIVGEFAMALFWATLNMTRVWSVPSFPWP